MNFLLVSAWSWLYQTLDFILLFKTEQPYSSIISIMFCKYLFNIYCKLFWASLRRTSLVKRPIFVISTFITTSLDISPPKFMLKIVFSQSKSIKMYGFSDSYFQQPQLSGRHHPYGQSGGSPYHHHHRRPPLQQHNPFLVKTEYGFTSNFYQRPSMTMLWDQTSQLPKDAFKHVEQRYDYNYI